VKLIAPLQDPAKRISDPQLVCDMPLPVASEVHGLAALQRQRCNAVHLIAIRDAAVSSGSELS